ncbi:hypothetical protein AVEN_191089-1 [Araneus ventricosus]|uniref:Uncharacterized protein n=1 Tax=Araneus ventricosus TaxID=182803 RepID=A0A4Y2AXZ4_ARAVE|nr:hypothetical protein AVEN_191089-1 [Araneus ventricosus]
MPGLRARRLYLPVLLQSGNNLLPAGTVSASYHYTALQAPPAHLASRMLPIPSTPTALVCNPENGGLRKPLPSTRQQKIEPQDDYIKQHPRLVLYQRF